MVVFGAGASYDSAQAFRLAYPGGGSYSSAGVPPAALQQTGGPWRPPLAGDLFGDPNHAFRHIVKRYEKLAHILPYLREPGAGRSVEEELEFLQALGNPERKRQFASVMYYLRDLLFEISDQWHAQTSGVTNYAPLVDEILRCNKGGEPVCLVTFNYDLLLDRALRSFGYDDRRSPHDQFKAHSVLKLFKPHGSVNWARFVDMTGFVDVNPQGRLLPEHLIERADTMKLTDEFTIIGGIDASSSFPNGRNAFPVIAIPFQNKTQNTFVWPPSHQTYLLELLSHVTKILIIGWQAREAHFMELLRSNLRGVTHLMVVGKDMRDSDRVREYFVREVAKGGAVSAYIAARFGELLKHSLNSPFLRKQM
jgi:hypothetical protein